MRNLAYAEALDERHHQRGRGDLYTKCWWEGGRVKAIVLHPLLCFEVEVYQLQVYVEITRDLLENGKDCGVVTCKCLEDFGLVDGSMPIFFFV